MGIVPAEYAILVNRLPAHSMGDIGLKAESTRKPGPNALPAIYGLVAETPLRFQLPIEGSLAIELTSYGDSRKAK